MIDRLALDAKRLEGVAQAVELVADIPDPVGAEIARWTRPNGLDIARVRTPIGVIAIIYESRPNVTADAAALCVRSGNAAILRGGSDSFHSGSRYPRRRRRGSGGGRPARRLRPDGSPPPTAPPWACCCRASTAPST